VIKIKKVIKKIKKVIKKKQMNDYNQFIYSNILYVNNNNDNNYNNNIDNNVENNDKNMIK
jgi:hypothetical protein